MTTTITTTARELREGRSLVEPDLFHRLVQRVAEEHGHDLNMAARVMDQALAFLGTSVTHQGRPLSPSEEVDPGWHEFILHTVDYAAFCEQIAGRFLHHVPTDPRDPSTQGESAHEAIQYTVDAIATAGFYVDTDLWPTAKTQVALVTAPPHAWRIADRDFAAVRPAVPSRRTRRARWRRCQPRTIAR